MLAEDVHVGEKVVQFPALEALHAPSSIRHVHRVVF